MAGRIKFEDVQLDGLQRLSSEAATPLLREIGRDRERGVDIVAAQKGVSPADLIDLLADCVAREARSGEGSQLRAFIQSEIRPNLLLLLPAVVVLGLLGLSIRPWAPPYAKQLVVGAGGELPAFHLIGEGDLTESESPQRDRAFTSRDEVLGRYTLTAVSPGAVLQAHHLSARCGGAPAAGEAAARAPTPTPTPHVMTIPMKGAALGSVKPGHCVSLLIASRSTAANPPEPFVLKDVTVLAVHRGSEASTSMVIAAVISDENRTAMGRLLGAADVFVLSPPPPRT